MTLRDENSGWYLAMDAGLVQLIQIDFRLGLFLSDAPHTAQLYIETPCLLRRAEGDILLTPEHSTSLAPILPFFGTKVIGIAIQESGRLTVELSFGVVLEVDPDASYEAWQLGCSIGLLLVCSPGGSVSVFRESNRKSKAT